MIPWLDIARDFGLYAGRGLPTPEIFKKLGLPTHSIFFTRTSDVKKWDECPMEYRYSNMDTRVPNSAVEPAWSLVGSAIHAMVSNYAVEQVPHKEFSEQQAKFLTESASLTPSEYDSGKLMEGALLLPQLADAMASDEFPEKLGFKRIITTEETMWLWIPAWAIGVCNGDLNAVNYAVERSKGNLSSPRPTWSGCFGVVLMFKVDVIGENMHGKTELLQVKSYGDDDVETLSTLLSFGLHEMVYNIGTALVADQEGWPPVVESSLLAIKKEVRKLADVPLQKTVCDAIEKNKVAVDDDNNLVRVDCTDKQWERFAEMWERWKTKLKYNKQLYDTWPTRVLQFMQMDQKYEHQKRLFMALGRRLGSILQAEDAPQLLHLTANNESACKKMYGRPCAYRYAYGCGGYDDLQNPVEWKYRELDYVNAAAANFQVKAVNNGAAQ